MCDLMMWELFDAGALCFVGLWCCVCVCDVMVLCLCMCVGLRIAE